MCLTLFDPCSIQGKIQKSVVLSIATKLAKPTNITHMHTQSSQNHEMNFGQFAELSPPHSIQDMLPEYIM